MKMKEQIENNVLIAMFMNSDKSGSYWYLPQHEEIQKIPRSYDCEDVAHFGNEELKYNKDWNWIMPVVRKIIQLSDDCPSDYYSGLIDSLTTINIDNVWCEVVGFIKWYNNNT